MLPDCPISLNSENLLLKS